MNNKPDFICIGPEKTATTWLFSVLEGHPEVWLPPYKELRFLTEGNLVPEYSLKNLFFSTNWHYRELRRVLLRSTVKFLLRRKTGPFSANEAYRWVLHYMFGSHGFVWYDSLFSHHESIIAGDITPNYYHIPESRIQALYAHNAQTQILMFVRNPIDRAWSAALMNYCQHEGRSFESISDAEWIAMLDDIYTLWKPYPDVIVRWQRYFPDMHLAWFDGLKDDPYIFLQEVAEYLGISVPQSTLVDKVIGKGVGRVMPDAIRSHLAVQYEDEIERMVKLGLSPYPKQWAL